MPKLQVIKASAILTGLSILAISAVTVFAQDLPTAAQAKPPRALAPGINKSQTIPPRLTNADIENKLANMREKLASKEAILKTKLQSFRDQKKATAAARISTNLNKINQNQTFFMQKHLDVMSAVLDKLETRINQTSPDIKDPAAAGAALDSARVTIATASAAVAAQTQKDYTIQASSENRIRKDAQTMRDNLHKDILALRKIIRDAKQAVINAIKTARSGAEVNTEIETKEATISGR